MRFRATVCQSTSRDDQVLPLTRWVAASIVPFLLVAFGILYVFPDHTRELFAWNIQPRMSAMMLGSAYLGGAYFFVRAALDARWHWVHVGFLPVTTFATLMGIATILHWDRFRHEHIAFYAWFILYFTTPFLVCFVWWRNRTRDPGEPDIPDRIVPIPVRWALGSLGGVTILLSVVLFLQPQRILAIWPWQLTPLTARIMGSLFALTGVGEVTIARDARWSAVRIALQSLVIGVIAICLAIVFSWQEIRYNNPLTWLFIFGMFVLLVAFLVFIFGTEQRMGKQRTAMKS